MELAQNRFMSLDGR